MARPSPVPVRRRRFVPASAPRVTRLSFGVRLEDSAREAGLTLTRASQIERDPSLARGDELARLLDAIPRVVGSRK